MKSKYNINVKQYIIYLNSKKVKQASNITIYNYLKQVYLLIMEIIKKIQNYTKD